MSSLTRSHFLAALAGGLVTVMLTAVLPAVAGDGESLVLGEKNAAKTVTRLNTRGGLRIDNFKTGNPALVLNVADPASAPFQVNATGMVENLNADLLDGMEAGAFARSAEIDPFVLALAPGYATWPVYTSDLTLEWQCLTNGTANLIWHHSPGGDWYLGGVLQGSNSVTIVSLAYGEEAVLGVDVPLSSLTAHTSSYTAAMLAPGGVFSNGPGYLGATCVGSGVVFVQDFG